MGISARLRREAGRFSLVDGIPFELPVAGSQSPALLAIYTIDAHRARALLPGNELHPLRVWSNTALLVIIVVNYRVTNIGRYVEFSLSVPCTHGSRPAPRLLPALFARQFDSGQFVYDLPVSSEISVKGGKGIWGMPKHQANLDFVVEANRVSSQYDLNGQMVLRVTVPRPKPWLPVGMNGTNFCQFRGMLMKSLVYFQGTFGISVRSARARLELGTHPLAGALAELGISRLPLVTGYTPGIHGVLDDHVESWFLSHDTLPSRPPEGLDSVVNLGLSQAWLPPPNRGAAISDASDPRGQPALWR